MKSLFALTLAIAQRRRRLTELVQKYGRTDARVLAYDRRLHRDIVEYQRRAVLEPGGEA